MLKSHLEEEAEVSISGKDVITQWLVRWAAMLSSRFLVGKDGKTAYESRRGRVCDVPVEKFGEKVWYKELHGKTSEVKKFESLWKEGLWLGHARNSNEVLIGTREGVVRAWAIRKKPSNEQWDRELIKEMKGTPAKPNPNKPGVTIPITISFDSLGDEESVEKMKPARQEAGPRGIYIKEWMLDDFGHTEECPGCLSKRAGLTVPLWRMA